MTMQRGERNRLLCISPYFPPLVNAEATCSGKVINELVRAGVDVTAISIAYPKGHPDYAFDESPVWRDLERFEIAISGHGRVPKLFSGPLAIKYQVSSFPRWLHEVLRVAKDLHKTDPFRVIYSRSYPIVAHVAAFWLQQKL